ncbi:hypothetical protein GF420_08615 [candidate division GN15 bacterium]|nr:hypothetical protein [candidate division GN15 bacterium]
MTERYRFALIGHDISYSRSPAIFSAIFDDLDVAGRYDLIDVEPGKLPQVLETIRHDGTQGFSVTIPYKQDVIEALDDVNATVKALDAVNCVRVEEGGQLSGHNTDCYGFALPLLTIGGELAGGRAVLFGNGGAARAVAFSLSTAFRINEFLILGREPARLGEFSDWLKAIAPEAQVVTKPIDQVSSDDVTQTAIVVNCTPLGGFNHPDQSPFDPIGGPVEGQVYYDLNYNPGNQVVAAARPQVKHVLDGSHMLVGQAVRSFEIWTGKTADPKSVYRRVFGAGA